MRVVMCSLLLTWVAVSNAETMEQVNDLPKVTVEASGGGSGDRQDKMSLRRLIAWRKGDVYFRSGPIVTLRVKKVLKGSLHDPNFPKRPVGVNNLYVIAINDAAIAVEKFEDCHVDGEWVLTKLPDGSYFVATLADTPVKFEDITTEKNAIVAIINDLESEDPNCQNMALQKLKKMKCFTCVDSIFGLLDSESKVILPNGMCVLYADGRGKNVAGRIHPWRRGSQGSVTADGPLANAILPDRRRR